MFSLIIPSKRGDKMLKHTLETIAVNTPEKIKYETIVCTEDMPFNKKLNMMVKKATGDYLIFLHDDCEVSPGWLDEVNECGAFNVGEWCGEVQCWGQFYEGGHFCTDPRQSPDFNFFCMLSRKVAKKVFPLDEFFYHPWGQDQDFGLTIKSKGYNFKCLKGKIKHNHARGGTGPQEQVDYLKNKWG